MLGLGKKQILTIFLRVSVIIICLLGIIMCAFVYPIIVTVGTTGIPTDPVEPLRSELIAFWIQIHFYWFTSIPCFLILLIVWGISNEVTKGLLFSQKVADRLNISSIILAIDCAIFLLGQIVLAIVYGWNGVSMLFTSMGVVGLIFSYGLFFAGRYIGEVAEIKAENEER